MLRINRLPHSKGLYPNNHPTLFDSAFLSRAELASNPLHRSGGRCPPARTRATSPRQSPTRQLPQLNPPFTKVTERAVVRKSVLAHRSPVLRFPSARRR